MAEHIWTLLCKDSIVDADTNTISLINVIEDITVEKRHENPDNKDHEGQPQINFDGSLVSLWAREDEEEGEIFSIRTRMISPQKKVINTSDPIELSLENHIRVRARIAVPAIPFDLAGGTHNIKIQSRKNKQSRWKNVTSVPIKITFKNS